MARISLSNVSKVFPDGTEAVSALDLEIHDGESMVLVGPSGCGKTTALQMVAGLETISSGTIIIGDRIVNDVPAKDRDIAMVFQSYALYPHLSVYDNMAFGLRLRRTPAHEIDRRVRAAADTLGLRELLNRKPKVLSGGQRQRVAMGRAIVREPKAFLMDEPLSNLDAKLRVHMRAEISRLQRDLRATTIYVTHDQVEAMTIGDRAAVMRQGRLQQVDTPQNLYRRPLNLFVAGFIGSPTMNLVEARFRKYKSKHFIEFGSSQLHIGEDILSERPKLGEYVDRNLIVGLRPEDIDDGSLAVDAPAECRLRAIVDLREELGSHVLVHFKIDTPNVRSDQTRKLAADLGTTAIEAFEKQNRRESGVFVAQLNPRTKAKERSSIDLVVDTSRMYFFDRDSALAIY